MSGTALRRATLGALAAVSLSCGGGDGGSGPSGGSGLAGTWIVTFGDLTFPGIQCASPSLRLTLADAGGQLTGSFSADGAGLCTIGTELYSGTMGSGQLQAGTRNGTTLNLDLKTLFQLDGSVSGDSAGGTVAWTVAFQGQPNPFDLSGSWSARRLPGNTPNGTAWRLMFTATTAIFPQTLTASIPLAAFDRAGAPTSLPAGLTWSTSTSSRADVSAQGLVTAKTSIGIFRVRADAGRAWAEAVGYVSQRPTTVTVQPGTLAFTRGGQAQLQAAVTDAAGGAVSPLLTTWETSDSTIAWVSQSGIVTTQGRSGQAVITARSGPAAGTVQVTVTLVPATLSIAPDTIALQHGATQLLGAQVRDSGGTAILDAEPTWTTTDATIVTVSAAGLATGGTGTGLATATASFNGLSDSLVVLARPGPFPATTTRLQLAADAEDIALSPAGAFYVTLANGFGLGRGDLPGRTITSNLGAAWTAGVVAMNPAGTRAYAGSTATGHVLVVDVAGNAVVDSLAEPAALALATAADGATLYVGNARGLFSYDAATLAPIDSVLLGAVRGILRHPVTALLFVSGDSLVEVNAASLTAARTFSRPGPHGTLGQLAITPDGATLFVAEAGVGLRRVDVASGLETRRTARGGSGVAYSATRDLLFVTTQGGAGGLDVLDPTTLVPVYHAVMIGPGRRVAMSPDGQTGLIVDQTGSLFFVE